MKVVSPAYGTGDNSLGHEKETTMTSEENKNIDDLVAKINKGKNSNSGRKATHSTEQVFETFEKVVSEIDEGDLFTYNYVRVQAQLHLGGDAYVPTAMVGTWLKTQPAITQIRCVNRDTRLPGSGFYKGMTEAQVRELCTAHLQKFAEATLHDSAPATTTRTSRKVVNVEEALKLLG